MNIKKFLFDLKNNFRIHQAVHALKRGGIVAYPTEAVYGLGCDPFNEAAVLRLLQLKKRDIKKGLILIAHSWEQIVALDLLEPVAPEILQAVLASWPGHTTWVFPAKANAPKWLTGEHNSLAIRVTAHLLASALAKKFGPLVSTSANVADLLPARSVTELKKQFSSGIDYVLQGSLGGAAQVSQIKTIIDTRLLRA